MYQWASIIYATFQVFTLYNSSHDKQSGVFIISAELFQNHKIKTS